MTTSAKTNYGVDLAIGDGGTPTETFTSIGEIVTLDPPELMNDAVEATNHGSGGWREFISGGLKEVSEFKATVNYIPANTDALTAIVTAGTSHNFEMSFPNTDVWSFASLITKFKPLSSDATSPDTLQAELTFRPTGSNSIA